jgi:hypothetical protein
LEEKVLGENVTLTEIRDPLPSWWPVLVKDGSAYKLRAVNRALRAATIREITGGRVFLGDDLVEVK